MKRRTEQRVLAILQLILFVVLVGTLVCFLIKRGKGNDAESLAESESGNVIHSSRSGEKRPDSPVQGSKGTAMECILFDPNTADSTTLIRVGLSPYQVRNLLKYRHKGGQYHRPEDMKSLYGLTVGQWEHIAPLIRIGKEYQYLADNEDVSRSYPNQNRRSDTHATTTDKKATDDQEYYGSQGSPFHSAHKIPKLKAGEHIDLSQADTTDLQRIPGIGSYYARRIALYGERLGGYVSVSQLDDKDLDFLPPGIEAYVELPHPNIKKLRINHFSVRELNHHPYISYPQAKQIAERIRLYGPFKTWDELLFLSEFTERDKKRLEPYISFE